MVIQDAVTISEEVRSGAVFGSVRLYNVGDPTKPEGSAQRILALTYPTQALRQTLSAVAQRLSGERAQGTFIFAGDYGTGKSHTLLALYHILHSPDDGREWLDRDDVNGFFREREAATNRMERFVHDTYFEVYDILLERIRTEDRARYFAPGEGLVVLLDGMSIREAALLPARLSRYGYAVEATGFALSEAPSSTQVFTRRVFGTHSVTTLKTWNGFQVVPVRSGEVPAVLPTGLNVLVWLSYPDELMHKVKGKTLTPAEALDKTVAALVDVLGKLEGTRFRLLSDHGYVYAPSARFVWKAPRGDEKVLRRLFGGGRWVAAEKMTDPGFDGLRAIPPQRAYALFDEQGCYIRGRYGWSTQGSRQGDVDHYGLSLMECLTPRLTVRS